VIIFANFVVLQTTMITNSLQNSLPKEKDLLSRDWGEALTNPNFFGRTAELTTLGQWIVQDNCRLVALLGMGGMGKSALSVRFASQVQTHFDYVLWRSLRESPAIERILADGIQFFSGQQDISVMETVALQIQQLTQYLQNHRCLLILDNVESILQSGSRIGEYRPGFATYGILIQSFIKAVHGSCLILTSREKPQEVAIAESQQAPVRSLQLSGVNAIVGREIFRARGRFFGTPDEWRTTIDHYGGNPLALKIVAAHIRDVLGGNLADFLDYLVQNKLNFVDIRDILDRNFERLSSIEKDVAFWLVVNREPVSLEALRADFNIEIASADIAAGLSSLEERSVLETNRDKSTLQNVVMEYMTERFIQLIVTEIISQQLVFFDSHALIKATVKDYVRDSQIRLILQPIADRLLREFNGLPALVAHLQQLLLQIRSQSSQGYGAGNLLNLLLFIQADLSQYNFSDLFICQAHLQEQVLPRVNFAGATFDRSIFTETFGNILCAAFSPNGQTIATGDTSGNVCLWDATGIQKLFVGLHDNWVTGITFRPADQAIISCSEDETIKIWDAQTGECLKTFTGHTGWIMAIDLSHDGHLLVSGSIDHTVKVWDAHSGECLHTLIGHNDWLYSVAISADGNWVASGGNDSLLRLWNPHTGDCIYTLTGNTGRIQKVVFDPNGQYVLSAANRQVLMWDLQTGQLLRSFAFPGFINMIELNQNASILAVSLVEALQLLDLQTGQCIKTLQGHSRKVPALSFSPDGERLVSGGYDQKIKLWDTNNGRCVKTWEGKVNWLRTVVFSPDGRTLASGGIEPEISLWDIATGQCVSNLVGHTSSLKEVSFSHDGTMISSACDDADTRIWDVATGECLHILKGHSTIVLSSAFSSDDRILASSSEDNTIRLWDTVTGQNLAILTGHSNWVQCVTFSPVSPLLASASSDRTIRLWDISNYQTAGPSQILSGHTGMVRCVVFSPDGQTLASSSDDRTVKLWNVATGDCLKTFSGHRDWIWEVDFSADGQSLVSGSEDNTLRIWDIATGDCRHILAGHTNWVRAVRFSPDARTIVSASEDETIKIWDAATGQCLRTLRHQRSYEGMNITGIKGLTPAQIATLIMLGAIDNTAVL
jgi:WD40 repeat protein